MIHGHGGNKIGLARELNCPVDRIVDMSSNLNPLGPPPLVHDLIRENMEAIHSLPEPDAGGMRRGFARFHGIDPNQVIAGNGTTFFIYTIPRALGAKKAVIAGPTYSDYQDACTMEGLDVTHCLAESGDGFLPDMDRISAMAALADLVFICTPNNPTGALVDREDISWLLNRHPDTCFVVDESYLPFVDDSRSLSFVGETARPNLLVLSSMSKIFRIPGLRTGFVSGSGKLLDRVAALYQPWSVNALAQAVISGVYDSPGIIEPFIEDTRTYIRKEKKRFVREVETFPGIRLFDGSAYFILAELDDIPAPEFCARVGKDRILIRDCSNFHGLDNRFVRFSLKTREINQALVLSIQKALGLSSDPVSAGALSFRGAGCNG